MKDITKKEEQRRNRKENNRIILNKKDQEKITETIERKLWSYD